MMGLKFCSQVNPIKYFQSPTFPLIGMTPCGPHKAVHTKLTWMEFKCTCPYTEGERERVQAIGLQGLLVVRKEWFISTNKGPTYGYATLTSIKEVDPVFWILVFWRPVSLCWYAFSYLSHTTIHQLNSDSSFSHLVMWMDHGGNEPYWTIYSMCNLLSSGVV